MVQAELVSARSVIGPGEHFTVALHQQISPGWHTYWRNAGDSGIPTSLKWKLPAGYEADPILWPAPMAIPTETLVNYGYETDVMLPVEITVPAGAAGKAALQVKASWLVCKDICIPEDAELALDIPVSAHGQDDANWSAKIAAARAAVPQAVGLDARVGRDGKSWRLDISGGRLAAPIAAREVRNAAFFPFAGDAIDHAAPQHPQVSVDAISFSLTPAPNSTLGSGPLGGIITYEIKQNGTWAPQAAEISAAPGIVTPSGPHADTLGLIAALGFALVGGLILNVMPCVFPVLSIKALSLARGGHEGEARRHGLYFLAGVMTTFLALAGALIALQAAGAQIGWGFQLQEPVVVSSLALLFFVIGLNLLGAFEFGGGVQALGGNLAARGDDAGAFFTGALAVVAATPCTAPFMGAAMGFAATQPPLISLAVFAALGLGFAAPFFALSVVPPLRALLPKPGAWMEAFKQILAFPMFAATIWLVWVLDQQKGANGALIALVACLAVGFIVWSLKTFSKGAGRWIAAALGILLLIGAGAALVAMRGEAKAPSLVQAGSEPWTPARQAELRAAGKPVFVDFTAAWCVTCQVNERVALRAPEVAAAFAKRGIVYLVADWTSQDSVIANELKEHGRAGVPLYVFYPANAGAAPKILPQILTPGIVLDALGPPTGG